MTVSAIRGAVLTFTGDPFLEGIEHVMHYESDALIVMRDGLITHFGPFDTTRKELPDEIPITHYKNSLITSGFVDCHVHYPQTQMIGCCGKQLLDWLHSYTFPTEAQFSSIEHSREVANVYLTECLRNGTTTAMVYCTVHPESVTAFFEESSKRNMRNIAGKVLMDRNAPDSMLRSCQQGYDESLNLLEKWHNKGRQLYAVTPRFAPTSSVEQLEMSAELWKKKPNLYLQTHIAETVDEGTWVKELFPNRNHYLDVFDHYEMVGPRSVYGHGIHLSESELERFHETGAALSHCPTSNLFLGSGLFDLKNATAKKRPVRVGLGTDLGAGTSFSPLQTLNEAYKIGQMKGYTLSSPLAFYLATRGGAKALYLEDKIGSIGVGMEADLAVIDLRSTPIIDYRMRYCETLEEMLFVQMIMGDERAIQATYVAGTLT